MATQEHLDPIRGRISQSGAGLRIGLRPRAEIVDRKSLRSMASDSVVPAASPSTPPSNSCFGYKIRSFDSVSTVSFK